MPTRNALRRHLRSLRRELTEDIYTDASRRIVQAVRTLPEFESARVVHSYWPSMRHREVDIRPLIQDVVDRGHTVILPVVTVYGPPTGTPRLAHVEYQPGMPMAPNRWNILEPVGGTPMSTDTVDLIFVPALACDAHGHRLGYGLGYYDEFLSGAPGVRVCVCMNTFLVAKIEPELHDQRVDIIVTESRIIRTKDRNTP